LIEKSFKWKLSNSGKPKSVIYMNRYGNPEPSPEALELKFDFRVKTKTQNFKIKIPGRCRDSTGATLT
jgi:hypothetical protein